MDAAKYVLCVVESRGIWFDLCYTPCSIRAFDREREACTIEQPALIEVVTAVMLLRLCPHMVIHCNAVIFGHTGIQRRFYISSQFQNPITMYNVYSRVEPIKTSI